MRLKISADTAYRIYNLPDGETAILYHIKSGNYMFLDGLSAELLDILLNSDEEILLKWTQKNGITEKDIEEFIENLYRYGAITKSEKDIKNPCQQATWENIADDSKYNGELNVLINKLYNNGLFYNFHFDLTCKCNEHCVHCYHPFSTYDYSKELSTAQILQIVDMIYDLGVFFVTLSGGEAMLRKDFFEILEYISKKGMLTVVYTNGLLLTEENVEKLAQYRVKLISISLYSNIAAIHDSITKVNGSFERTMEGITRLKQHALPFELKTVALKENIDTLDSYRQWAEKFNNNRPLKIDFSICGQLNGNCSNFDHAAPIESVKSVFYCNPERYMFTKEFEEKHPFDPVCGAGKYGLYCNSFGEISPCVTFSLKLCNWTELPNIRKNSILNRWLKITLGDFSDCFKHDYCKYCPHPCAGNNLIENGNFLDSKNVSICKQTKIIAEWYRSVDNI